MNNEPAFPRPAVFTQTPGLASTEQSGMSIRDYFAAKAMQGMLSDPNRRGSSDAYADDAYRMADAMLAAREAKK